MHIETALLWSWLNILNKKRYDALVKVYGSLEKATANIDEELLKGLSCKEDTIYKVLNRFEEFDPDVYQKELTKRGLGLISLEDEQYPASLKSTDDPPVFLYYKGSLDILQQPCIALVGTRSMSDYGERVTEQFTSSFIGAGLVTVSGLALGVDTIVAKESLRCNGPTVAVLAHGLAQISPKSNERLAKEIVDSGGLILSEYPLDQVPDVYTFPARNRIVAGLSIATVVIEAPLGSGSLITADLAFGYSREVFAVPGLIYDENYQGCHEILHRNSAKIARSPESVLSDIGVVQPSKGKIERFEPQNSLEEALWKLLGALPQQVTDLVEKSHLETSEVNAQLTMMELRGVVKNVGNGWVKMQ